MPSAHREVMLHAGARKAAASLAASGLKGACKRIPSGGLEKFRRHSVVCIMADGFPSYRTVTGFVPAGSIATQALTHIAHNQRGALPTPGCRALPHRAEFNTDPTRAPFVPVRRAFSVSVRQRVDKLPGSDSRDRLLRSKSPTTKRYEKEASRFVLGNATPGEGSSGPETPSVAPAVVSKREVSSGVAPVDSQNLDDRPPAGQLAEHKKPEKELLPAVPDVFIVDTTAKARQLVARLRTRHQGAVFACDTEVSGLDIKKDTPVNHGELICFSLYCGDDISEGPRARRIWVDITGEKEKGGILEAFKAFFEDDSIKKVWHNYSFDRHILENVGMSPRGFQADTMHMARLLHSSRKPPNGYSLESLSADPSVMQPEDFNAMGADKKRSMKERFGHRKIKKDGTPGVAVLVPDMLELQQGEGTRAEWIDYSTLDAKCTWHLHRSLESRLRGVTGVVCYGHPHVKTLMDYYEEFWRPFGEILVDMELAGFHVDRDHLSNIEQKAKQEGQQLSDLVREWAATRCPDARYMNTNSEQQVRQLLFGGFPNKGNNGKPEEKKSYLPIERVFKIPNTEGFVEPGREGKAPRKFRNITLRNILAPLKGAADDAAAADAVNGRDPSTVASSGGAPLFPGLSNLDAFEGIGGFEDADDGGGVWDKSVETEVAEEAAPAKKRGGRAAKAAAKDEKDKVEVKMGGDSDGDGRVGVGPGMLPINELPSTTAGWPGCSGVVLRTLAGNVEAGDVKKLGPAYQAFGGGEPGVQACRALAALWKMNSIDALLSNFILPLQGSAISGKEGRIHCSLNLNTETGRLSARRPNLQNQPALEKDIYKIRSAFSAEKGNMLIVADYGQLELRILAHMSGCESMTQAFLEGGDFHSRTAMGMYPHVRAAVDKGDVLLEWDTEKDGPPPKPLLKNVFASERRKAKTLNFSIAYGKTAQGLAKDWKVTEVEAKQTVEAWYKDRPKVEKWQQSQRDFLAKHRYICTLLGRRRMLPKRAAEPNATTKTTRSQRKSPEESREERQAINTPIQGSAADIVMLAMLRIAKSARLRELGWRLLLQVHDEVILEGPEGSADEAKDLVVEYMSNPFGPVDGSQGRAAEGAPVQLNVALPVDARYARSWYDAK